jgi:serine/threonine-protein kinase
MAVCPTCREHFDDDVATCPHDAATLVPDAVAAAEDAPLEAGTVVGDYRVEGLLGTGGFGSVYRAVHTFIGKLAAIKVLGRRFSTDPQMVSRFIAEARSVNQIRHPHIIDIFGFGALPDGRQYYVMELLEGAPLDAHIRRSGRLPLADVLAILRRVAQALAAAHAHGITHRDLKPENIFIALDADGRPFPKLLDFGIAKLLGQSMASHKTATGTPIGTPYYMAPEQCMGKSVDARTDVYAFGVVAYELMTGGLPFVADSAMAIMMQHVTTPPEPPSARARELGTAFDQVLLRILAKEPASRPASVTEAYDLLAQAAGALGLACEPASMGPSSLAAPVARIQSGEGVSADAKTIAAEAPAVTAGGPITTHLGGEVMAPRARPPRLAGIAVAGAVAALAAVGWILFPRPRAEPPAREAPPASGVAPAATPTVAPVSPPAPTPQPSAAPAADVTLTVRVEPSGATAEIFAGERRLGVAGKPFSVPRSTESLGLQIRATGFLPKETNVTPDGDKELVVELKRASKTEGPRGPGATPKAVEW